MAFRPEKRRIVGVAALQVPRLIREAALLVNATACGAGEPQMTGEMARGRRGRAPTV